MNRDVMEAHLTILGWRPVKFKPYRFYKGHCYGARSERQCCGLVFHRVRLEYITGGEEFEDIEWRQITDDVLRRITNTIDGEVGGWSGCE